MKADVDQQSIQFDSKDVQIIPAKMELKIKESYHDEVVYTNEPQLNN